MPRPTKSRCNHFCRTPGDLDHPATFDLLITPTDLQRRAFGLIDQTPCSQNQDTRNPRMYLSHMDFIAGRVPELQPSHGLPAEGAVSNRLMVIFIIQPHHFKIQDRYARAATLRELVGIFACRQIPTKSA